MEQKLTTYEVLLLVLSAFDRDDVPAKNIALRRAYDEIERLRAAAGGEQGGDGKIAEIDGLARVRFAPDDPL